MDMWEYIKQYGTTLAVITVLGTLNIRVYNIDKAVGEAKCTKGSKWSALLLFIVSFLIGIITASTLSDGTMRSDTGYEHYLIPATLLLTIICCCGLLYECSKIDGVKTNIGSLLAICILLLGGYLWVYKETYKSHGSRLLGKISSSKQEDVDGDAYGMKDRSGGEPVGKYRRNFPRGRF